MPNKFLIVSLLFFCFNFSALAQEKEKEDDQSGELTVENASVVKEPLDPLTPARAAFYSAVLPGLGQAYNKKYWKIPIVYAALGTGIYFYINNNNEYNRYRDAYKSRLAGFENDEFFGRVTDEGLRNAQKIFRRNKELSLLITAGIYALNIIDANVDAHLLQYNVDDNLSLEPHLKFNELDAKTNLGLTLNFSF